MVGLLKGDLSDYDEQFQCRYKYRFEVRPSVYSRTVRERNILCDYQEMGQSILLRAKVNPIQIVSSQG